MQRGRALGLMVAILLFPCVAPAQNVCQGEVREVASGGETSRFEIDRQQCHDQVKCPGEKRCERLTSEIVGTGGFREWCGCPGTEQPTQCHTAVVHQPPLSRGPHEERGVIDCFFTCPHPGEKCCEILLRSELKGEGRNQRFVNHYACACLSEVNLRDGECPKVSHPGVD